MDSIRPLVNTVVDLMPFIDRPNKAVDTKSILNEESLKVIIGLYPTAEEEKLLNEHLSKTPVPPFPKVF